jgi:D-alanyl-D-alanine carboxypeptidase/D-alanyl-D-alanine-endopeptidase (penicillin-binding protein 4)
VATTIAALHHWGPDHRFETRLSATGPVQNGTLQGDLILQSDGDPIIEWEEAIALGNALNRSGVRNIAGNLVIVGNLTVSFEEDLPKSADLLKQAWSALTWSADFEYAYRSLPPGTPRPQITIAGAVQLVAGNIARSPKQILLVRHQSPPLRQILKVMNVESNNTIAQVLTDAIGGTAAMSNQAATLAGVPSTEILLKNGSGLGLENRLSPGRCVRCLRRFSGCCNPTASPWPTYFQFLASIKELWKTARFPGLPW